MEERILRSRRENTWEKAKEKMPVEYESGVWNNILFYSAFPADADRSTYGRVKSKFIYDVAEEMGFI